MFSTLYGTHFPFYMHFKMSSAIRFNLDQSKILLPGNGLNAGKITISVCERVKNIVGKGENACCQQRLRKVS